MVVLCRHDLTPIAQTRGIWTNLARMTGNIGTDEIMVTNAEDNSEEYPEIVYDGDESPEDKAVVKYLYERWNKEKKSNLTPLCFGEWLLYKFGMIKTN